MAHTVTQIWLLTSNVDASEGEEVIAVFSSKTKAIAGAERFMLSRWSWLELSEWTRTINREEVVWWEHGSCRVIVRSSDLDPEVVR